MELDTIVEELKKKKEFYGKFSKTHDVSEMSDDEALSNDRRRMAANYLLSKVEFLLSNTDSLSESEKYDEFRKEEELILRRVSFE